LTLQGQQLIFGSQLRAVSLSGLSLTPVHTFARDMIFEQDPVQILDALLPLPEPVCCWGLPESAASELAARMTAMNNAATAWRTNWQPVLIT